MRLLSVVFNSLRPTLRKGIECGLSSRIKDSNIISDLSRIRNIGISAHIDSGKTTLTERLLFYTGIIQEMHEVKGRDKVGATMDFMDLERERGITIQSATTFLLWRDHNINVIDTPGHVDFTVEVERALRVLDGAVLVVCAAGGVQSQTFTVNRQLQRYKVPFFAFINKLDRRGANPALTLQELRTKLRLPAVPLQIPMGVESNHSGVIDLVSEESVFFEGPLGINAVRREIPEEFRGEAAEARRHLVESVAQIDDAVAEYFIEECPVPIEVLKAGIRRACISREMVPVLYGTALRNKGVQLVLDSVIDYLPNPSEVPNHAYKGREEQSESFSLDSSRNSGCPFVAMAFKLEAGKYGQLTYVRIYQGSVKRGDSLFNSRDGKKVRIGRIGRMHANDMHDIEEAHAGDIVTFFGIQCCSGDTFTSINPKEELIHLESMFVPNPVVSMSIRPVDNNKLANFSKAINRFTREDPTFLYKYDAENKEAIVSGMGELHIEIYAQRMEREYGTKVELGKPLVTFLETLRQPVEVDYLHKQQTGGSGQYGRVIGTFLPLGGDKYTTFEFSDRTVGTNVPKQFVPIIERGIRASAEKGCLIGRKVSGIRFELTDGDHHLVDSNELAFLAAAKGAFDQAFKYGNWELLEPVMNVEVYSPTEFYHRLLDIVGTRQGVVTDQKYDDEITTIYAEVTLNKMFGFCVDLRAGTRGLGEYTMEYAFYRPVSPDLYDSLVADYRAKIIPSAGQKKKK